MSVPSGGLEGSRVGGAKCILQKTTINIAGIVSSSVYKTRLAPRDPTLKQVKPEMTIAANAPESLYQYE
jgi:hypothetical protein